MNAFLERLRRGPPLLLDGGLGSMLIARGLGAGEAPERWNRLRPADVRAVHRAYVEAGSEAVHANTFGGNTVRLGAHGLGAEGSELNRAAVALARSAGARFVIGDVGPTGEYLAPVGRGDRARWHAAFLDQGRALAEAGVDALHVETMTDLREAEVALLALCEAAPGIPRMVSLTFERRRRGFFTLMGDPLAGALAALAGAGADAVGANCTLASADMRALAAEARAATECPLVVQPNAGMPSLHDGEARYGQAPEAFADDMAAVAALGIRAVGGCCGTTPAFVAALARCLRASKELA